MQLYILFIGLLILLIVGLGVLLGSMDVVNIKAEWAKRRCDPTIMFSAFLYKPTDDPRSSAEFAADNFQFCVRSLIDDVFKELLSPVLGVVSAQMGAAETTGGVLNSLRNQLGNAYRSFSEIFEDFFQTYVRGTHQLSRITSILRQAMLKVNAAVVSIVFMGMSLMISLLNVKDFIIRVVMIIMTILIAMIVLLFFALVPFMPLIFATIAVLAGVGAGVGGFAGAFCVDPAALVLMADGTTKPISLIQLGEQLGNNCGIVEGLLETDFTGDLFSLKGIKISGSHLLYSSDSSPPIFVNESSEAIPSNATLEKYVILNTSSHKIPLVGDSGEIVIVGDWEEILDDKGRAAWSAIVSEILGAPAQRSDSQEQALFSSAATVVDVIKNKEVSIASIKRGDIIRDIDGKPVRVVGIYRGVLSARSAKAVWFRDPATAAWTTGRVVEWLPLLSPHYKEGYNLITESGTFRVITTGKIIYDVRDFTEVGWQNLEKTYESTKAGIRKIYTE